MSANIAKVQSVIENTFNSAIAKLTAQGAEKMFSDLFVQADSDTGELTIYDENSEPLEKTIIFDWINNSGEEDDFTRKVSGLLKSVLSQMKGRKAFDLPCFMRPFAISLTDEDFSIIEALLVIDDESLDFGGPLMKNLDPELDNFLSKLLSDFK